MGALVLVTTILMGISPVKSSSLSSCPRGASGSISLVGYRLQKKKPDGGLRSHSHLQISLKPITCENPSRCSWQLHAVGNPIEIHYM